MRSMWESIGREERGQGVGGIPNREFLVMHNSPGFVSTLPWGLGQIVSSLSSVFSIHKIMGLDNKRQ